MACENFEQFLRLASARIPGKRLRERIRKELGDHMEDMLADKIEAGTDEEEAKKQVLLEMGNPDALRKAFVRAHRAEIRLTRLGSILTAVILLNCFFVFALPCFKEAAVYFSADTLQEAEQKIREENGEVAFIGTAQYNGRVFRFYMQKNPPDNGQGIVCFSSIEVFGKNISTRFSNYSGVSTPKTDNLYFCELLSYPEYRYFENSSADFWEWNDQTPVRRPPQSEAYIFVRQTEVAYLQVVSYPQPTDMDSEELTALTKSVFFRNDAYAKAKELGILPVHGAYIPVPEAPCVVQVDIPSGTLYWETRFYDAQKNEIQVDA